MSHFKLPTFFYSLFFSLLCFNAISQSNTSKLLPLDPSVRTGKLANGMTYYIQHNENPKKRAELRLAVKAGSILENDNQLGLAHFVEHMAFNGTKSFKKNELIEVLEMSGVKFGAHLNAYTSFDETVYMLKVPTDSSKVFDKGMQILYEWSNAVSFEDAEIDKERGVVIEEWRGGRGADARMRDKYFPVLLHQSQYAKRLPIGEKKILESFKYETLKQFYKDWYRPDLMAVIVVGDVNVDEVEKKIKAQFSQLPVVKNARKRQEFPIPNHKETLISIEKDKEAVYNTASIYIKHNHADLKTEDDYRMEIMQGLYTSMINERIAELLQSPQPPFLYGASNYGHFIGERDAYSIYGIVKNGEYLKGLETLLIENERVKKYGFLPSELERQKDVVMNRMEKAFLEKDKAKSDQLVREYISLFLNDVAAPGISYEYEYYKKYLKGIKLEEVNKLAAKWLTTENKIILLTGQDNPENKMPSKEEIMQLVNSIPSRDIKPYEDKVSDQPLFGKALSETKIVEEKTNVMIGTTELKLANGVKVILKPTDFKNDEILLSAYSPGGHSIYDNSKFASTSFASTINSLSGVAGFDDIQLKKKLAGKRVSTSFSIGELYEYINGSVSPRDAEVMFQLIYLNFTQPRKDSTAYLSYLSRLKTVLANRGSDPQSVFNDSLQVLLSSNHLRRQPITVKKLDEIKLDEAYKAFKDRYADASDFTFFMVGNFKVDSIKPLISKYLGNLPSTNRKENWKDIDVNMPKGKNTKTIIKGKEPKSSVRLYYYNKEKYSKESAFMIKAVSVILNNKLLEKLREDKGGVYGVSCSGNFSRKPKEQYTMMVAFNCSPDNVDSLINEVNKEVENIKTQGPSEKELIRFKETERRTFETSLRENGFWLGQLSSAYENQESPEDFLNYTKYLDTLKASDVKEAAKKYLKDDNYIKAILVPEK